MMFDDGHFCLMIFAQGPWKPKYKEKLRQEVQSSFLASLVARSKEEEHRLGFAETARIPLFDPEELGKSQRECQICSRINALFKETLGRNEGLILFSHTVPDVQGFKTFVKPLFKDPRIKKMYYYELGPETVVIDQTKYLPLLKERTDRRLSKDEFFKLLDANKFQLNVLYEIY
jgi:hypothetical protein